MVFVGATGAAILGGAAITGGLGYLASQNASSAQVSAETAALNAQNQARSQLGPFIHLGAGAAGQLAKLTGNQSIGGPLTTTNNPDYTPFINSPDYAFALSQGNAALTNYLNATGTAKSGGALTAVSQYNQGLASQQYGNYFNRLMGLANLGSNAAAAGVGGANAAAGTLGAIGQSTASGIIGGTNAVTGSINNGIQSGLLWQYMNRGQSPSGYGTPSSPYPNAADLGWGNGVATGGFNFQDLSASLGGRGY